MEYCTNCRAVRPTRKSSRRRSVRQPDGTMKNVVVESYHCARCNHFVGSIERDAAPQPAAATGEAAPAEEAVADVEVA